MADSLLPAYLQSFSTGDRYGYTGVTPELAMREQALNRRQQIANLLIQKGLQPRQGQMAGRFYVAPSPVQGLADLASVAAGAFGTHQIDENRKGLASKDKEMLAEAIQGYQKATSPQSVELPGPGAPVQTATPGQGFTEEELQQPVGGRSSLKDATDALFAQRSPAYFQEGPRPTVEVPATSEQRRKALVDLMASENLQAQGIGKSMLQLEAGEQEKATNREFLKGEADLNRENRVAVAREQMGNALTMATLAGVGKADLERMREQNALDVARIGAKGKTESAEIRAGAGANKPMPPRALQMQQEELDAIGMASSINADLAALEKQVDSGTLKLGPVQNLLSSGKNTIGLSDESSRNFATFKATMEKQRNDSLRLNKGVQTEGDSVRAWNELFQNLNDPGVVKQRLAEIQRINERAANIRQMNVDVIRQNYGKEPLETEGYRNQVPAVGQGMTPTPHAPFHEPDEEQAYQEYKRKNREEFLRTHKP